MIEVRDILNIDVQEDGTCKIRYRLSHGETPYEAVYLERIVNRIETERLMRSLSDVVDSYNRG